MSTTFTLTHVGADGQYKQPETVGYAVKELNKRTDLIPAPLKGYFNENQFTFSVPTEKANDVEQVLISLNPKFLSAPKFTFTKSSMGGYRRKHRKTSRKSRKHRNSRKTGRKSRRN